MSNIEYCKNQNGKIINTKKEKGKEMSKHYKRLMISLVVFSIGFTPNSLLAYKQVEYFESILTTKENLYVSKMDEYNKQIELKGLSALNYQEISYEKKLYIEQYDEQIAQLKNYYSESELKDKFNYSDAQANAIVNFDGSEEMRIATSTIITSDLKTTRYRFDSTRIDLRFDINFNGVDGGLVLLQRKIGISLADIIGTISFVSASASLRYRTNSGLTHTLTRNHVSNQSWRHILNSSNNNIIGIEHTFSNVIAYLEPGSFDEYSQIFINGATLNYSVNIMNHTDNNDLTLLGYYISQHIPNPFAVLLGIAGMYIGVKKKSDVVTLMSLLVPVLSSLDGWKVVSKNYRYCERNSSNGVCYLTTI